MAKARGTLQCTGVLIGRAVSEHPEKTAPSHRSIALPVTANGNRDRDKNSSCWELAAHLTAASNDNSIYTLGRYKWPQANPVIVCCLFTSVKHTWKVSGSWCLHECLLFAEQ